MVYAKTGSVYKAIPADAAGAFGFNASGIIFDELHTQRTRELWDALTTSIGARRQPLVLAITTAGYDRQSICWEQHEHARQVLAKAIQDPRCLPVIYAAGERDDWTSSKTWRKANPSLGKTVSLQYLREECLKAKQTPAYQNTFRRLHLNEWTQQETRWLDMATWDACSGLVDPEALVGRPCYGGLDVASKLDLAAFVLLFPPIQEGEPWIVLPRFWVPGERIAQRTLRDRVPYDAWARDGFLEATAGNVIDYRAIRAGITDWAARYQILEIAFDAWEATAITTDLISDGFTMVETRMGWVTMSAPTKELERLLISQALRHGGHPVLRWMADNVVVHQDPAGNLKPDKGKSREKIDGIVATILAVSRGVVHALPGSVYESRGVLVV
jgi:phage terminase large subunit-like protein